MKVNAPIVSAGPLYTDFGGTKVVRMAEEDKTTVRVFDVRRGGSWRMKKTTFNDQFSEVVTIRVDLERKEVFSDSR